MTSIPLDVHEDYVSAETSAWWAAIADYSESLTESLRDWLSYRDGDRDGYYTGQTHPYTEHIVRWAGVTFRADDRTRRETDAWWEMCTGLYGEGAPWEVHTINEGDNLLSGEIGAVWFYAPDGSLIIVETTDESAYGCYVSPVVYRVKVSDEALTEYTRASGECRNGHLWTTEDGGIRMHLDGNYAGAGVRIDECIRPIPSGHYVACPECGTGVRLFINLWD